MAQKILVVDDEERVRNLLESFLRRQGHEVVLAANGEEALELAAKERPAMILLDVKMPRLDGLEVCRKLKQDQETSHIPVIMATAYKDHLEEALDTGADDFISKPFHLAELSVRVKSILRVRHLTDELERAAAYIKELQENLPKA